VKSLAANRRDTVFEHINSIPTTSSHYSRAKSPYRKYLPSGLNINSLYSLYSEWMSEKHPEIEKVSPHYYRDIFNQNFNIGFEPPKSDTCAFCDRIENDIKLCTDDTRKRELNVQKEVHLRRSMAVHKLLKKLKDDTNEECEVLCFDLQQTLPTPKLTTSVQYYKRKLWTYNFCVHDVKTGRATMYLWNETTAKRGSIEICNCLMNYIEKQTPANRKTLILFSDNCGGQNKNINLVLSCLRKIHEGRFEEINHYFMVPGHSYLPCDRNFGHIEKKLRGVDVFSEDHYAKLILEARTTRPFNVIQMKRNDFKNYSDLQKYVTRRKAKFKDAKVLIYRSAYKQGYEISNSFTFDRNSVDKVPLQKGKKKSYDNVAFDLSKITLELSYEGPILLSKEKCQDVKDLLPFVPQHYKTFLDNVIHEQQELHSRQASDVADDDDLEENDFDDDEQDYN
jgi:hypothetical protein